MKPESENILAELLADGITETRRTQLLDQLSADEDALKVYQLVVDADSFIGDLPKEAPSDKFNEGVLLGYRRIKTREKNNRLMTYFLGVATAIIALILAFAGDASTSIPQTSAPILDQIGNRIPDWSFNLDTDNLIQLVLVLNAGLLLVLIEKIVSKRKILNLHSLI